MSDVKVTGTPRSCMVCQAPCGDAAKPPLVAAVFTAPDDAGCLVEVAHICIRCFAAGSLWAARQAAFACGTGEIASAAAQGV